MGFAAILRDQMRVWRLHCSDLYEVQRVARQCSLTCGLGILGSTTQRQAGRERERVCVCDEDVYIYIYTFAHRLSHIFIYIYI